MYCLNLYSCLHYVHLHISNMVFESFTVVLARVSETSHVHGVSLSGYQPCELKNWNFLIHEPLKHHGLLSP